MHVSKLILYWEFRGHLGTLTQDEVNLKAVISTVGLLTGTLSCRDM